MGKFPAPKAPVIVGIPTTTRTSSEKPTRDWPGTSGTTRPMGESKGKKGLVGVPLRWICLTQVQPGRVKGSRRSGNLVLPPSPSSRVWWSLGQRPGKEWLWYWLVLTSGHSQGHLASKDWNSDPVIPALHPAQGAAPGPGSQHLWNVKLTTAGGGPEDLGAGL